MKTLTESDVQEQLDQVDEQHGLRVAEKRKLKKLGGAVGADPAGSGEVVLRDFEATTTEVVLSEGFRATTTDGDIIEMAPDATLDVDGRQIHVADLVAAYQRKKAGMAVSEARVQACFDEVDKQFNIC